MRHRSTLSHLLRPHSHFRPISVTPVISRIVKRRSIIVNKFILPFLPAKLLADQFAYRLTCSTTAALVALEHYVAQYLESVSFVQCLSIDYSKSFDTISHPILFQKLLGLNLLPNVTSWIFNFLTGRTHSVSVGGCFSDWIPSSQYCTMILNWTLSVHSLHYGPQITFSL